MWFVSGCTSGWSRVLVGLTCGLALALAGCGGSQGSPDSVTFVGVISTVAGDTTQPATNGSAYVYVPPSAGARGATRQFPGLPGFDIPIPDEWDLIAGIIETLPATGKAFHARDDGAYKLEVTRGILASGARVILTTSDETYQEYVLDNLDALPAATTRVERSPALGPRTEEEPGVVEDVAAGTFEALAEYVGIPTDAYSALSSLR